MSSANACSQTDLVDGAIAWLRDRLPDSWTVERPPRELAIGRKPRQTVDSILSLAGPNGTFATLAVEARPSFSPRDATTLLPSIAQLVRSIGGNVPLLVLAPWLSKRSQALLAEEGVNYLDMTGNALIRLDNPTLYLEAVGALRDPQPKPRGRPQLTGAKAARLIRMLTDVRPPYGVRELADASDLTAGYVSQLLGTLYREALLERTNRGAVTSVDVPALVRRWADSYDVFKTNGTETFIAPAGVGRLLSELAESPNAGVEIAITGSFAATRLAPIASPAMLIAYCDSPAALGKSLGLLPADEGANVALLEPFDPVVWLRTSIEGRLRYAATSQVAVDCLTGNGRMPAEGEALLEWMEAHEEAWRLASLDELESTLR